MRFANLFLTTLVAGAAVVPVAAQRVVPVHKEPRHRLIFESEALRVLDVQIQPSDTTLLHRHATPITYVTIGTSSTDSRTIDGNWQGTEPRNPPPGRIGAMRAVLSYENRPITHQVTNVGSTLFRLIAVPNLGPGADGGAQGPLPGEALRENRWFRHASLTLPTAGESDVFQAPAPTVIVMIRDGRGSVVLEDGSTISLERAGQVAIIDGNTPYQIRNGGTTSADFAVVEVR